MHLIERIRVLEDGTSVLSVNAFARKRISVFFVLPCRSAILPPHNRSGRNPGFDEVLWICGISGIGKEKMNPETFAMNASHKTWVSLAAAFTAGYKDAGANANGNACSFDAK
jgi:hypothetical protein